MEKNSKQERDCREKSGSKKGCRKENILDERSFEKTSSTVSRRQFLGGMGAAAVAAAMGCGDRSSSSVDIDGGPDEHDDGGLDVDGGPVVVEDGGPVVVEDGGQNGDPEDYDPTLWVSPSGSDSNTGTSPQNAFRTIQHAIDQAEGGDVIQILAGFYQERVIVRDRSFSQENPLIIQGEEGVVIDGGHQLDNWEPVSTLNGNSVEDTYRTFIGTAGEDSLERADWHTVDGRTVYALRNQASDPHRYFRRTEPPSGNWESLHAIFYKTDGWVYFRHKDRLSPSAFHIRRCRFRDSAILLRDASYVILRKLKVQTGFYTIQLRDTNNVVVDCCRVFHGDNSIRITGNSSNNVIRRNYATVNHIWNDFGGARAFSQLHFGLWGFVKGVSTSNHRGIYFYRCTGTDNLVENNLVYKHWDGFQAHEVNGMVEGGLSSAEREATRGKNVNLTVRNNSFIWNQDSASSIEFGGENFRFHNNFLHEGSNLLRWKGCFIGPTYIFNNVITCRMIQTWEESYTTTGGTYFSPGDMLHTYADIFVYHNTFAFVSRGLSINSSRGVDGNLVNLTLVNNIFECHWDVCSYDPDATEGYSFYGGNFRGSWPSTSNSSNIIESNGGVPTEHNRIWEMPENTDEIITWDFSLPAGHPAISGGLNVSQPWSLGSKSFSELPDVPYGPGVTPPMGCFDPQTVGQTFWHYETTIQENGTVPT